MKPYPNEVIDEAKSLYIKKKWGALRILRQVQKDFPDETKGLQLSTVSKWIKTKGWKESRIKVEKKTEEKFIEAMSDENVKELKIIDSAISYILTDMKDRRIRSNLSNLSELVKLRMLKRGEATDRTEIAGIDIIQKRLKEAYQTNKK